MLQCVDAVLPVGTDGKSEAFAHVLVACQQLVVRLLNVLHAGIGLAKLPLLLLLDLVCGAPYRGQLDVDQLRP
jgi:hypothetical protein